MPFQKGHPQYGGRKKKEKEPPAPEPLCCLFCEGTNVDGERGQCLDCETASAEMLTKMWTGKSRMQPLSHTMSNLGANHAVHRNYHGPNRFSGG